MEIVRDIHSNSLVDLLNIHVYRENIKACSDHIYLSISEWHDDIVEYTLYLIDIYMKEEVGSLIRENFEDQLEESVTGVLKEHIKHQYHIGKKNIDGEISSGFVLYDDAIIDVCEQFLDVAYKVYYTVITPRRSYVGNAIRRKPDVIVMQEAPSDQQLHELLEIDDYKISRFTMGANQLYENLMTLQNKLSAWKITSTTIIKSGDKCYGQDKRVSTVQAATHLTTGSQVQIANIHLCGGRFDEKKLCKPNPKFPSFTVRERKVNMLDKIILQETNPNIPSIILGDFNSDYLSYKYKHDANKINHLTNLGCSPTDARMWHNAPFELLDTHGYHIGKERKAKPTSSYGALSDTIWHRGNLTINQNKILDGKNKNFQYSDHHGVLASFTVGDV